MEWRRRQGWKYNKTRLEWSSRSRVKEGIDSKAQHKQEGTRGEQPKQFNPLKNY